MNEFKTDLDWMYDAVDFGVCITRLSRWERFLIWFKPYRIVKHGGLFIKLKRLMGTVVIIDTWWLVG